MRRKSATFALTVVLTLATGAPDTRAAPAVAPQCYPLRSDRGLPTT
jgi:hypothetical protein